MFLFLYELELETIKIKLQFKLQFTETHKPWTKHDQLSINEDLN